MTTTPILLTHRARWGGAELTLLDLVGGLPRNEFSVTAAVPPGRFQRELASRGFDTVQVDFPSWRKGRDLLRNWRCRRSVARLARNRNSSIVVAGDIRTVPYAIAAAGNNCPCVAIIQDGTIEERHVRAYCVHKATLVLCPSVGLLERTHRGGVARERIRLMPIGIDTDRFRPIAVESSLRTEWNIEKEAVLVGCIGNISHLKGQDLLLDAVSPILEQDDRVQLILVGSQHGEFAFRLKSCASKFMDSGRVRFLGWREDIPAVLAALDIVAVPSRRESFSRVAAEAMAVGKPIIATKTGAVEDLFKNDRCGLSVPPADVLPIREALIKLIADPDMRRRLGVAARERICRSFNLQNSQRAFLQTLRSVLRGQLQTTDADDKWTRNGHTHSPACKTLQ